MEIIKISEVNPAKYNPRLMNNAEFENLKKSLKKYGCVRPLIINKKNKVLISGHQTVRAAKELDFKELPVLYVDLDEVNEKKLNLALNRISGEWDYEKLSSILGSFDNLEYTGFSQAEYTAMGDFSIGKGDYEKQEIVGKIGEERIPLSFYIPKKEYTALHQYFGGTANHDIKKLKNVAAAGKKNKIKFNGDLLNPLTSDDKEFFKFKKAVKLATKNGRTK
jgi:hypothetical protein